jgi:hypothetical protein
VARQDRPLDPPDAFLDGPNLGVEGGRLAVRGDGGDEPVAPPLQIVDIDGQFDGDRLGRLDGIQQLVGRQVPAGLDLEYQHGGSPHVRSGVEYRRLRSWWKHRFRHNQREPLMILASCQVPVGGALSMTKTANNGLFAAVGWRVTRSLIHDVV